MRVILLRVINGEMQGNEEAEGGAAELTSSMMAGLRVPVGLVALRGMAL